MSNSICSEILSKLGNLNKPLRVNGLNGSATAYFISELLADSDKKFLIVCPEKDLAQQLLADMAVFSKLPDEAFQSFPGWDSSPYLSLQPSVKNSIQRLQVLQRLNDASLRCVVTDLAAFAQKNVSADSLRARGFEMKVGDFISRDELVEKLERAGYKRFDPVEDVGTYCFRGNICDIYTSFDSRPYRLEFFGDDLESIRKYDRNTQRSFEEKEEKIRIPAVSSAEISDKTKSQVKARIKEYSDHHGVPKKTRDEINERIDLGLIESSFEFLTPLLVEKSCWSSLSTELTKDWTIVAIEPLGLDSKIIEITETLHEEYEAAVNEKNLVVSPDELFETKENLSALTKNSPALIFSTIALDGDESIEFHENIGLTFETFCEKVIDFNAKKDRVVVYVSTKSQGERLQYLLEQKIPNRKSVEIIEGSISAGFQLPSIQLRIFNDAEAFGSGVKIKSALSAPKQKKNEPSPFEGLGTFLSSLDDLNPSDYVVHLKHGVGRYLGMVKLQIDKIEQDFLLVEYAANDKLYLPIYRLDQIQRYIGGDGDALVALDKLGTANFEKTKAKVKSELQDLAHELLKLYAERAMRVGHAYNVTDESISAFESRFPYAETPDQLKAINDISSDMGSSKIMDRLVCGDVGYGKTEVAMRAAFTAVSNSKQVAVLVPTTVLALQHERTFVERFRGTAVKIAAISRFKTAKEIKESLEGLKKGSVDIIIGTHRLLSRDVEFKDLGLLVVDEEQRFGVEHKERLKAIRLNADVLTLTATPIPRTLQFSLMGLRDISVINTAPVDRLSVRTFVSRFDDGVVRTAIRQEMARGGQVFFLHNRVQTIELMAKRIKEAVPEARIIIAHGQLSEAQLEQRMLDFYNKKGDVLLCSTIIESGLDIPSANTIMINRADSLGLAQLYQLRGRVGRSQLRAFCYLLLPEEGALTADARKRIEIIQKFAELGSGFKVASHDLELRGGGDIIGKSQSGHIAAVGYELFLELLEETIHEIRGQKVEDHFDPEIKLPVAALIPEDYIPDPHQRLGHYKKLSESKNNDELHEIEVEMQDRYGAPPAETMNLFSLIRIKQLLRAHRIKTLTVGKDRISLEPTEGTDISIPKVLNLVSSGQGDTQLTPESKIVIKHKFDTAQELHLSLSEFISKVAQG